MDFFLPLDSKNLFKNQDISRIVTGVARSGEIALKIFFFVRVDKMTAF